MSAWTVCYRQCLGVVTIAVAVALAWQDAWTPLSAILVVLGVGIGFTWPAFAAALLLVSFPMLDFTAWAGQSVWRHHDYLVLGVCTGWWWVSLRSGRETTGWLTFVYVSWVTIAAGFGWAYLVSDADPGAIVHLSAGNAIRVAKGYWLALLVVATYPRRTRADSIPNVMIDMAWGAPFALIYIGCWCAIERWLFVGWGEWDRYFRVGGPMSGATNLGGQASEAIILQLMAWSLLAWRSAARRRWRWWVLVGLGSGATALLLMQTRSTLVVMLIGGALLVTAMVVRTGVGRVRWLLVGGGGLACVITAVLLSPGWKARFEGLPEDWRLRLAHYQTTIQFIGSDPSTLLRGHGLGTFPTRFRHQPTAGASSGWFAGQDLDGVSILEVHGGRPSYLGWNVPPIALTAATVQVELRGSVPEFRVHLCEKNLMHSVGCRSAQITAGALITPQALVPAATGVSDDLAERSINPVEAPLIGPELGQPQMQLGPLKICRPLYLSIGVPRSGMTAEISAISLLDENGVTVWDRDRFGAGVPGAIMTTDHYWPFHLENDVLLVVFEQGIVGLVLLALLVGVAGVRAFRVRAAGGWLCLGMVGVGVVVGIVNSPLDTPESTMIWLLPIFALSQPRGTVSRGEVSDFVTSRCQPERKGGGNVQWKKLFQETQRDVSVLRPDSVSDFAGLQSLAESRNSGDIASNGQQAGSRPLMDG